MKRLNHTLRWDNLDLLGIAIFLSILSFFIIETLPCLILYLFFARKHLSWILFGLGCFLFIFLWMLTADETDLTYIDHMGVIIDKDTYDFSERYVIRVEQKKYHLYAPQGTFDVGHRVHIKGQINRYENATVPHGFDPYMYYRSKQILGKIDMESYDILGQKITFYHLRDQLIDHLKMKGTSIYVLHTFFGQSLDEETKSMYDQLGITYLLSVSGLHLFVLVEILKKILYYFSVSDKKQSILVLFFYGWLVYCHRLDIGILRLFIMHGLLMLNEHYTWRRSRFEILQLTFMIILFTNVSLLFSSGILISYIMMTMLYLIKPWLDLFDGYTKRLIYSGFFMIGLIPFFQRLDLVLLLMMPICIFLVAYGMTIGSLLVLLIPQLSLLLERYISWIEDALLVLHRISLAVIIPKMTIPWVIIFYGLMILFFLMKSKINKVWVVICCLMLFIMFHYVEKNESRLTFLDVGQGDSTILETKTCVAVIDSYDKTHDYLKHRGITNIDYLFLTHSDIDHIKDVDLILRDYRVDQVIGSLGVDTYPLNLKTKLTLAKAGDQYPCGETVFHILAPVKFYENENNASLVIQFDYQKNRVLLTADIEFEAESDLISHYGIKLKSDIMKIAHHGSNTSSSALFLHYVSPHTAIISVGRNNRYHFPSEDVMNRMMRYDMIIYRTDQLGTIVFDPSQKGEKWYFHLPFSPRFWYNMYRARGRMYG